MIRAYLLVLSLLVAAGPVHSQSTEGRLKKIAATGSITIAYRADAAPFSFVDGAKRVDGFAIDLCKRVVALIERQIGSKAPLQVKWLPVNTQTRFDSVAKGDADMECSSSTVTLARLKQVDFSSYIFVESTGLLTRAALGIRSLPDLEGKRIGVVAGTTNEAAVRAQLKERKLGATVVTFKTRDEGFAALEDGKTDAFASDKLLLIAAARKSKDQKALVLLAEDLSVEPYGIVLPRGDADFRLVVNAALAQVYRGREIVEIFGRWFGQFGEPSPVIRIMYFLGAIPE